MLFITKKRTMPIGVRFPFSPTSQGGIFDSTVTSADALRSNLISLLTTKRGHRVMNNNLYSPLYDYLFGPWDLIAEQELDKALRDKVQEFLPEVFIDNILYDFEENTNTLTVKLVYKIQSLGGLRDQVSISVNTEENI